MANTNLINARPNGGTPVIQQSRLLDQYVEQHADDLGGGILPSFPVLSIRGGKWRLKYKGEEIVISDDRGYPRPDLEVIIISSPRHKSKAFYPAGFDEANANVPPTCWSSDGKVPDASVPDEQLQNTICATCEQDKIGSKVTDNGKKTKACGDHKRLVVVPAEDILNEAFGGVMLLRVPASSLGPLQGYGDFLKSNRVIYYGCSTILAFDPETSFPKINFEYGKPLDDTEVNMVLDARKSEQVARILNEEIAVTDPSTAEPPTGDEESEVDPGNEATPESNQEVSGAQLSPATTYVKPQPMVAQPQRAQPQVHQAPQAPARPVQPQQARAATPVAATTAKPAPAPARQAQQPIQPAQTAQTTQRTAGAGFGGRPQAPQTQAPVAQRTAGFGGTKSTPSAGTINSAMARPAARPVTTRPVAQPVQPQPQTQAPVIQEEMPLGEMPDELEAQFGQLMSS